MTDVPLFDVEPFGGPIGPEEEHLSAGQKLTIRNNRSLAAGIHPATLRPLAPGDWTCATCEHHEIVDHRSRTYHKCELHRLGMRHSEASDIRVSWAACTLYLPDPSKR